MTLHCARTLSNNRDARLLLPLWGRRWPGHRASERTPVASDGLLAGSDEGSVLRSKSLAMFADPHPTLADARATFSHKWEKETRTKIPSFVRGDNAHA
jgi:hypothetical protein